MSRGLQAQRASCWAAARWLVHLLQPVLIPGALLPSTKNTCGITRGRSPSLMWQHRGRRAGAGGRARRRLRRLSPTLTLSSDDRAEVRPPRWTQYCPSLACELLVARRCLVVSRHSLQSRPRLSQPNMPLLQRRRSSRRTASHQQRARLPAPRRLPQHRPRALPIGLPIPPVARKMSRLRLLQAVRQATGGWADSTSAAVVG